MYYIIKGVDKLGYTKEYILTKCAEAFKDKNTFYKQSFINYRGKTEDTDEYFTEVIASFLCDHIDEYKNGIDKISRKDYSVETHDGIIKNMNSNRDEEKIAMQMFNNEYDFIGKIIDYQTPLKSSKTDTGAGKIDLLAFDGETLRILELKKPDSEETMLRCVLEGFTYLKKADHKNLAESFKIKPKNIKASPFVFKESSQRKEFEDIQNGNRPFLKKLMALLDSKPYFIMENKNNNKYFVEE